LGLGPRVPGPTDCENFGLGIEGVLGLKLGFSMVERLKFWLYEGVVGEGSKSDESAEARFCARCTGRKMPEPGTDVWKYCVLHSNQYRRTLCGVECLYPSTAPSFFPRAAYSLLSSTPAKTPCLPRMLPTNLTTPFMPPGTSTKSPTPISRPSAPILDDGELCPPTKADRLACRAMFLLAFRDRLGDDAVG
jgi:hypothetical protein